MKQKGFTLIELLVVISIVGLLSSIVLASLRTARDKAADAAVKQQLSAMRTAANFLFDSSGTFNDVCLGTTDSGKLYESAYSKGSKVLNQSICVSSQGGVAGKCRFDLNTAENNPNQCATSNPGKWAATVQLKSAPNTWFCVDYSGKAEINSGPSGRTLDTSNDPDGAGPQPTQTIIDC